MEAQFTFEVELNTFGKEAKVMDVDERDLQLIKDLVEEFSKYFNPEISVKEIMSKNFTKLVLLSHKPYGKLYS